MKRLTVVALAAAASVASAAPGAGVKGSKHDLSVTGPGAIHAVSEANVCVACHLPHSGAMNRPDPRVQHIPYSSSTMSAKPGAPTGSSRLCLSCHDGTIAVGETKRGRIKMTQDFIPAGTPSNLGTDLRKTHPVSFRPSDAGRTHPPPGSDPVRLDRSGQVQCTSCHDPHKEWGDPFLGKFLVKPAERSALCLSCHDNLAVDAPGSSHASSTATYGAAEGNAAGFRSVAEAGCLACHPSHGADEKKGRLVARPGGDDDALCLRCHAGTVSRTNLKAELAKPYAHVATDKGVHDAAEGRPGRPETLPETSPGARRHVACVDCHDPHASTGQAAVAPGTASGALAGVWGIDQRGNRVEQVRFEYELCFKCHGDSANQPQAVGVPSPNAPVRAVVDVNLRKALAPSAISYHPVVAPGRSARVPGLVAPYNPASIIGCGDCHAAENGPGAGGSAPRGPHGSFYAHLLERNYSTLDRMPESASAYALCYKCHDRSTLVAPDRRDTIRYPDATAFPLHPRHLGPRGNAACAACHVSHGISAAAGTPQENRALVSFDTSVVKPYRGVRRFSSTAQGTGSCTLTCHNHDHDGVATGVYTPATPATP